LDDNYRGETGTSGTTSQGKSLHFFSDGFKKRILEQSTTREEDAYIDVEILMTDVRESWSRLQSHNIQVPAAAQNRLKEIHTTAKRQMLQIL
jgi:hypothetical protein